MLRHHIVAASQLSGYGGKPEHTIKTSQEKANKKKEERKSVLAMSSISGAEPEKGDGGGGKDVLHQIEILFTTSGVLLSCHIALYCTALGVCECACVNKVF